MKVLDYIEKLLVKGAALGGEVGVFFASANSYVIGTLVFISILYTLRRVPIIRAIHDYSILETRVDREQSQFMQMFTNPRLRVKINIAILISYVFLLLCYAIMMLYTLFIPFIVFFKEIDIPLFSVSMICLGIFAIEFWASWLLIRFIQQTSRSIRIDREDNA